MTTRGDQILDRTLSKVGGKGLFVKELETALEDGRADTGRALAQGRADGAARGFALACVLEREDPRDAFVSERVIASLAELPQGALVGTSSLRRVALLRALRPDLRIEPLRGNLDTRLRKLDEGRYDAIVLAAAGLKRLGLAERIRSVFEPDTMLPRPGRARWASRCGPTGRSAGAAGAAGHRPSWLASAAERAVSRALGGSCSMPLAAHAQWQADGTLRLDAAWGDPGGGAALVRARDEGEVAGLEQAEALGARVAQALRRAGAH